MSGRDENYHCHRSNIPDINYADRTITLASVERILRPDRAGIIVNQVLHETVGT